MKLTLPITLLLVLQVSGVVAAEPWTIENLGAHRLRGEEEFRRVLDKRCTRCHTSGRIEEAQQTQRDIEAIRKRMEKEGAVLTERDRAVLGTFWGSPLKKPRPRLP